MIPTQTDPLPTHGCGRPKFQATAEIATPQGVCLLCGWIGDSILIHVCPPKPAPPPLTEARVREIATEEWHRADERRRANAAVAAAWERMNCPPLPYYNEQARDRTLVERIERSLKDGEKALRETRAMVAEALRKGRTSL